jgi:serine/threonine protein kinase
MIGESSLGLTGLDDQLTTYAYTDLVMTKVVGKGTSGRVFRGTARGEEVAIKQISLDNIKLAKYANTEQDVLTRVNKSPHIVKLYGHLIHQNHNYIILEQLDVDLFHLMRKKRLNRSEVFYVAVHAVLGLLDLHAKNVCYRDLKPENVMISTAGKIKLIDFGFSKVLKSLRSSASASAPQKNYDQLERTKTVIGSPDYLAPEVLKKGGYALEVDWWALGILLFELL